ncbi:MAG TPA: Fic family protein, partial [Acidimicrobiia bacterium]|nr:Fic family protein [Acidimicrobiia bacterium]
ALYDSWLDWVREDRNPPDLQVLVHTALAHYQFETIHPYNDGNGRVGRLAAVLQIMRSGALSHPVLSISPWLRQNENEYKDHLLKVSTTGDWEPWITFFVEALTVESQRAQHRIGELLHLRESLSEEVRQLLPRGRLAVDVVDDLIEFPVISVGAVEHRYDKSNQAARNAVNRLIEVGLLEPFNDAKYDRLYWNPRVFQIIQRS